VTFLIILLAATIKIQSHQLKKINAERSRLESNQSDLLTENGELSVLSLRKDEVIGRYIRERDSLSEVLKIKPKQIIQVRYETIIQEEHDTIRVPVEIITDHFWRISDTGNCFSWRADAFLRDDSLKISRTVFDYANKTTYTYYKKRPNKFLFIRFGKWEYLTNIVPECGEAKTEIINFLK
jgi:hypothetical protein